MNTEKIKMSLTLDLLNRSTRRNTIGFVKTIMAEMKEVGAFVTSTLIDDKKLDSKNNIQRHSMQFENCILDINLVHNAHTNGQRIQGFELYR